MSRATYIYNHACGTCGGDAAAPPPADDPDGDLPVALVSVTSARALPLFGRPAVVDPVLRAVIEEQRSAFADVDLTAVTGGGG